jgi:hypothetical protein
LPFGQQFCRFGNGFAVMAMVLPREMDVIIHAQCVSMTHIFVCAPVFSDGRSQITIQKNPVVTSQVVRRCTSPHLLHCQSEGVAKIEWRSSSPLDANGV